MAAAVTDTGPESADRLEFTQAHERMYRWHGPHEMIRESC